MSEQDELDLQCVYLAAAIVMLLLELTFAGIVVWRDWKWNHDEPIWSISWDVAALPL